MKKTLVCFALLAGISPAIAGTHNNVPSCYDAHHLTNLKIPTEQEIFVLVDQTTLLDEKLRQSVRDNVSHFVKSGNAFSIASFSAFAQNHYLEVVNTGEIEPLINETMRDSIGTNTLKSFDACLHDQMNYAAKLMVTGINKTMATSSEKLERSDVMSSIKEFSSLVKQSSAKQKIVLIVSDMLENSSISTFYSARNVRNIDPQKELLLAQKNDQFGDFDKARVFILGAGIVSESKSNSFYRDPKTINALKTFWSEYFSHSNAKLVEFGAPALITPVQ